MLQTAKYWKIIQPSVHTGGHKDRQKETHWEKQKDRDTKVMKERKCCLLFGKVLVSKQCLWAIAALNCSRVMRSSHFNSLEGESFTWKGSSKPVWTGFINNFNSLEVESFTWTGSSKPVWTGFIYNFNSLEGESFTWTGSSKPVWTSFQRRQIF